MVPVPKWHVSVFVLNKYGWSQYIIGLCRTRKHLTIVTCLYKVAYRALLSLVTLQCFKIAPFDLLYATHCFDLPEVRKSWVPSFLETVSALPTRQGPLTHIFGAKQKTVGFTPSFRFCWFAGWSGIRLFILWFSFTMVVSSHCILHDKTCTVLCAAIFCLLCSIL